ncbi:MAG: tachylectin-related carbohydrate-binding protein [Angustibacter sp.]
MTTQKGTTMRQPMIRRIMLTGSALALSVAAAVAAPSASATTSSTTCSAAALLAINSSTHELSRWADANPADPGGVSARTVVGTGWRDARLLASDAATGYVYAVFQDGKLRQYAFNGSVYGSGTELGSGWSDATQLIPMGRGVLYAIFTDGTMRLYRVVNGTIQASSGSRIIGPTGWNTMGPVASGGVHGSTGVLYAVEKSTGKLYWYQRTDYDSMSGGWAPRREVGSGWSGTAHLMGAGDGLLYAITTAGELNLYDHKAPATGDATWSGPTRLGSGWTGYRAPTVNPNACTAATYSLPLPRSGLQRGDLTVPHHDSDPGIDLPATTSTPVLAAASGTVRSASVYGWTCGTGVIVRSAQGDDFVACHLSSVSVSMGSRVTAGTVLGYAGDTGNAQGVHLHFDIWAGGLGGVRTCPQSFLLALYDGRVPPEPSALPSTGCTRR